MTRWTLIGAVTFLSAIGCSDRDRAAVDAPPPQVRSTYEASAIAAGGMVTAVDSDGRPRFIWASGKQPAVRAGSPERAAREHLERFAAAYGIARADAARTRVLSTRRTRRGDHMVRLGQAVDGVPVYRGEVLVVLRPDLSLRVLSGTPSGLVGAKPADRRFLLDPGAALARALEDLYQVPVPAAFPSHARGSDTFLELPALATVQLSGPARARPVFYRDGDRLVAAYMTEFFSTRDPSTRSDATRALVAADDGRTLERHDLTADVAFNYRVFAEPTEEGRPLDGPIADYTPHPAGIPDGTSRRSAARTCTATGC